LAQEFYLDRSPATSCALASQVFPQVAIPLAAMMVAHVAYAMLSLCCAAKSDEFAASTATCSSPDCIADDSIKLLQKIVEVGSEEAKPSHMNIEDASHILEPREDMIKLMQAVDDGDIVAASRKQTNDICVDEGNGFDTPAEAKEYFNTSCVDSYGYDLVLCSALANKVFEAYELDSSDPWKPHTEMCNEINSLLCADDARRRELSNASLAPTVPSSSMLQRSAPSHSRSSSTLEIALEWKGLSDPLDPEVPFVPKQQEQTVKVEVRF